MPKRARGEVLICYLSNIQNDDHLNGGQGEHADLQPLSTGIGGT
jgi:hypothetical protein